MYTPPIRKTDEMQKRLSNKQSIYPALQSVINYNNESLESMPSIVYTIQVFEALIGEADAFSIHTDDTDMLSASGSTSRKKLTLKIHS